MDKAFFQAAANTLSMIPNLLSSVTIKSDRSPTMAPKYSPWLLLIATTLFPQITLSQDELRKLLKIEDIQIAETLQLIYTGEFDRYKAGASSWVAFEIVHQNYVIGFSESHSKCISGDSTTLTVTQGNTKNEIVMKKKFSKKFVEYFNQGHRGPLAIHALFKKSPHYQVMSFVERHACDSLVLKQFEDNLYKFSVSGH